MNLNLQEPETLRRKHIGLWALEKGDQLSFDSCAFGCTSPKHRGVLVSRYLLAGHPVGVVNLLCFPGKQTVVGLHFTRKRS